MHIVIVLTRKTIERFDGKTKVIKMIQHISNEEEHGQTFRLGFLDTQFDEYYGDPSR